MVLTPGALLGPYEILSALGAGGMGEVYRARDTKLNRDVAIKVLPEAFARDADRLARFTREARTLASLSHPNIAQIYGLEESRGVRALVMELVEGHDLSVLVARGPMPLAEALPIASQIAEALEAAHEQGIVHRDLKPANVKVRDDGLVKVLDFGLAKALGPEGATAEAMNSPTLTARATELGLILGTAAYMSPEQAKGKSIDKRADIWAFGAVLYELLAGQRAFKGDDVSETIASVLKDTPPLDALPAATPLRLTRLLQRCLDRDVKERLRDIGEARIEIARIQAGAPDPADASAPGPAAAPRSAVARMLPSASAAVFGVALVASLLIWSPWRSAPAPAPRKLLVNIGADASLTPLLLGATAILSPDGTTLVFVARQAGQSRLFVRRLDQLQATALAGTENASSPFFSPDGRWIAFFTLDQLKKVSVAGGAVVALCDAQGGRGGTWTNADAIIFAPLIAGKWKLMRVSAGGGTPAPFGTLGQDATDQLWPQVLPDGTSVLYTENSSTDFEQANLVVAPLVGGPPKVVIRGGYYGRYAPSGLASATRAGRESGHLVYMKQGKLFAARFVLNRLEAIGQPVAAIDDLMSSSGTGTAQLAFSSEGTLVYVRGEAVTTTYPIDWVTRDGSISMLRATKADWSNPRFSPKDQKLALDISDGKQQDIFVYEWARDTLTQLTFDPGQDRIPVWTPDGRRIVFSSDRAKRGIFNLYWMNADGTGEVTRLTDSPENQQAYSWSHDGKSLAFQANRGATGFDLMILPMAGDSVRGWKPGTPTVFLATPATELTPMFSPDGRWIMYRSTEVGGRLEIYVRPFPGSGGPWRISTAGGNYPLWSAAHELLFTDGEARVMFARYSDVGDSFNADKPQIWSPVAYRAVGLGAVGSPYDLHPDGTRLAIRAARDQTVVHDQVVFVSNFFEYLRTIAPGQK